MHTVLTGQACTGTAAQAIFSSLKHEWVWGSGTGMGSLESQRAFHRQEAARLGEPH